MKFSELMEKLNITEFPEYFPSLYDSLVPSGKLSETFFLEKEYIEGLHEKYDLFRHSIPALLESAKKVCEIRELLCYTNLLRVAMEDRKTYRKGKAATVPNPVEGDIGRNYVGMLAMLPHIDSTAKRMKERNFSQELFRYNLDKFEACMDTHTNRFGWQALNQTYFNWLQHFIDTDILPCGGFSFEMSYTTEMFPIALKNRKSGEVVLLMPGTRMHREGMVLGSADFTDDTGAYDAIFSETESEFSGYPCLETGFCSTEKCTYSKDEWEIALKLDDPVLKVHIPAGAKLAGDAFYQAYSEALKLFSQYEPDFTPKAIGCLSWLMDHRVDVLLGGGSNIGHFQSYYKLFPIKSKGEAVFNFVFTKPFKSYEELPEDTRLMRALKSWYLSGKHIHAFGGVIIL